MALLDSNILIYSSLKEHQYLRNFVNNKNYCVSEISVLEVLGYPKISSDEEKYFESIFNAVTIIPVSSEIIRTSIPLRKQYNLSIGDSIIAASAIYLGKELMTANVKDFKKIAGLTIINPLNI